MSSWVAFYSTVTHKTQIGLQSIKILDRVTRFGDDSLWTQTEMKHVVRVLSLLISLVIS